uniref:Uncharacterized protein n=1 Tax=Arion vulgaris TaxID=1028688 RepID=A0A0B6XY84_9EUPU
MKKMFWGIPCYKFSCIDQFQRSNVRSSSSRVQAKLVTMFRALFYYQHTRGVEVRCSPYIPKELSSLTCGAIKIFFLISVQVR